MAVTRALTAPATVRDCMLQCILAGFRAGVEWQGEPPLVFRLEGRREDDGDMYFIRDDVPALGWNSQTDILQV